MRPGKSISIWFFVGVCLLFYGALILGAGIYEYVRPPAPENQVVLFRLHAGIWWGALMTVLGAIYCYFFAPWRQKS
jgi:hypothetical protein